VRRQTVFLLTIVYCLSGVPFASAQEAPSATPGPPAASRPATGSAPAGPPLIPVGPLGDLDQLFIDSYTARRADFVLQSTPYIVVSGSNLILHRNGQKESARVIPDLYHALKDVAHLPFTIYLPLSPVAGSGGTLNDAAAAKLQTLVTRIQAARGVLKTSGYTAEELARQTQVVDESEALGFPDPGKTAD